MSDSLYLAWQYLRHQRLTAGVLVAAITLILFLPVALQVVVHHAERHLRSRATETPLLIGPRGSALELVLGSLYFDKPLDERMRWQQFRRVSEQSLGKAIPLHTKFTTRDCQIVGTTPDYFAQRQMTLSRGQAWDLMGECLVGAAAAKRLGVDVGDRIPVVSGTAFVLDSAPLRLRVVGLLNATDTPDDEALFVDIDTAWILEGLGHGHEPDAAHGSAEAQPYTDITPENAESFHFHGDRNAFPLTAMLVFPKDQKSETLLLGQYFSPEETVQIVRPPEILETLLQRILMVRSYLVVAIALVSLVTLLTMGLVMMLSVRLRQAELNTITKMGCSPYRITAILGMQMALLLGVSVAIAAVMVAATSWLGPQLVRWFVL